jgi:hypothetical protein
MGDVQVVRTREELKSAVKNKARKIIVKGKLAEKVNRSFKLRIVFKVLIGLFIVTPLATPLLLPMLPLFGAVMPVFTALEIALLLAIVIIGICLMLEICKGYESPR